MIEDITLLAIYVKYTKTLMALHESDGAPGDVIHLYKPNGDFIETCIISNY